MDLIDKQSVVEIAMCYCPDDDGICSKADTDIRELLDDIENLPVVNILIPCSEQLPDKDGNYLVLQRDRFEILEYRTELKQFGYTYEDEDEPGYPYTEWTEMQNVTHWMPLPNKPEGLNRG